ncbi:MAG: phosphatidylserine decarboxylase family protein [Proteobacteria bacterium]|nr:phosphatidylserine decarboxylase family protein [Pseudomonadota bacterium]
MESASTAYRPVPRQLPVAVEGFPFVAAALIAALAAWMMSLAWVSAAMLAFAAFTAFFFRNPRRKAPEGEGLVIAPADGRVISVEKGAIAPHTGEPATKVSIFMSILDVHVNRFPIAGTVRRAVYSAGRFFVASMDKASEHNERNSLVVEDAAGRRMVVVQIAGIVARRIVCYVREGDGLRAGDRFGLIRFGSRVDLYLPPEATVDLSPGARTRAGETVLGRFE